MARRNYSAELLAAADSGSDIVCSVAPYHGVNVVHSPRRDHDPFPWLLSANAGRMQYRYRGRECHATEKTEN
jgi:hypothetical protein